MKAIIIEDEELSANRLQKMVEQHTAVEIKSIFYSVNSALKWLKENECPDLFFLDIQLGDGTGFDLLDSLESYPQVIFTTAFDKYVLEVFKYNSVDYLLKPIKSDELVQAIEKIKKVRGHNDLDSMISSLKSSFKSPFKKKFLVKIGLKYQSIPVDEIAYFYSESSTTFIKTRSGESTIADHSLDEILKMVDPDRFFRINRHMIVCDEQIESIDSYFNNRLILSLNPTYPEHVIVSREKVREFKDWLDQ
ncbi:LytTR family DNA-binding domain-containing protein [Ekhidna sp.]|uniref:LytR/AlgR family response regulator transcription factor n=1 Tax=Ekhidna sp. TaxID=2608089 RepID=UPI003297E2C9